MFQHMFIQLKSNPTPLNFHHFTQQWSPVVVVQQIPRRGRRKWHGPPQQTHLPPAMEAGLGGKTQGTWPRSAQFQGQWERFNKKNTTCLGWEGLYSCISFKEDYVKIVWIQGGLCQDSMKKPTWIAKMPQISQAYIANPRPQGQVLMSFVKRPVHSSDRQKIKLTKGPLDYHQSSCQDSIWFIIIYSLNNYIEIHYSIDSYCECTFQWKKHVNLQPLSNVQLTLIFSAKKRREQSRELTTMGAQQVLPPMKLCVCNL